LFGAFEQTASAAPVDPGMAAIHKAKEELREAVALRKEITQQQELKEHMAEELQKRLDDVQKFQAAKSRQASV
jgi:hypothetical protein